MCVDLHTHSVHSDGTNTPSELVDMAATKRLQGLAITDHDTISGIAEAERRGREVGITVISGLEISAIHREYSLHLLGYNIDHENEELAFWLKRLQDGRKKRNHGILEKLTNLGIVLDMAEVEQISQCGQTGRPHIARLMVKRGIVKSVEQAFKDYLGRGRPAWCGRFCYTAGETIAMIHKAGGIAVLAHPGQLDPAMKIQPRLVAELCQFGLDGLEIFYPSHSRKARKRLHKLAAEYNLIATGGSDYHGATRPGQGLAGGSNPLCPPDSIIDRLFKRQTDTIQYPHKSNAVN